MSNDGLPLPDPSTVVVIGGGPAGSFFALRLLRRARELGRSIRVIILEKKSEICFYRPLPFCSWEGCNYCAGGISPRLTDFLREEGVSLPDEVIEGRPTEIIVHGDWKSIQLPVPPDREMLSVFRGSRPRQRAGRYVNFDTFLLRAAADAGAETLTAEATDVYYSADGRPVVSFRTVVEEDGGLPDRTQEADFVVFAGGVNHSPGVDPGFDPVFAAFRRMIPGLRPPKVRQAVIAEMTANDDRLRAVEGELHFMQYGSKDLHIEMASLMPKNGWVTAAMLGKSVDKSRLGDSLELVRMFVELPHIRRLLPPHTELIPRCSCHPNMTIGAAKRPYGHRVALTGDLAVSRLYKDGLYSAHVTSSALADCLLDAGVDKYCLSRHFGRVVRSFDTDNRYGRVIFLLSHWVFSHPLGSRILYQAILTERKTTRRKRRRLEPILWQVASGDDTYRRILARMMAPGALWLILVGGLLITIRNQATEFLFGLKWKGVGRYATGVPLEELERMRQELAGLPEPAPLVAPQPLASRPPEMERMYTIRVRASKDAILRQLGAFGDPDRHYLKPRFVRINRLTGLPNQVGTVIRYRVGILGLEFSVGLEWVEPDRYLLYRILDGMGRGGILAFVLGELKPGVNLLTVYVGFNFARGRGLRRLGWAVGRRIFPKFAHDVVWNHSLCEIKRLAEEDEAD
jgi:flavin-dependent dehydrogenase